MKGSLSRILGRITGISTPFGGISWSPGTPDVEIQTASPRSEEKAKWFFFLGCGVGNRVGILPLPPGEADSTPLKEFLEAAEALGFSHDKTLVQIRRAYERFSRKQSPDPSGAEVRTVAERYFQAMDELPDVVRAASTDEQYYWFTLGKLMYELATAMMIEEGLAPGAPRSVAIALSSAVERVALPPAVRTKVLEYASLGAAEQAHDWKAAFRKANELSKAIFLIL